MFNGKHFVINVFSPAKSLHIIRDVTSKLLIFSGNDGIPSSLNHINSSWNRTALLSAMIPTPPQSYPFSIESVTSNKEISFLCECYLFMDNHKSDANERHIYRSLADLLSSKEEVEKLSSDSLQLKAKVEECLGVLGEIGNNDKTFEHAKRIKERYSDLI
ncbi:hypothetical protein [Salinivibrio kushneri]|uniref:hypothetical protein n=1 Tax=Salinivibrio kushneri TaxID=1908198 RepID=UPI0022B5B65A|nr:hypothetical protein [Salinivibrio kushneri]WBA11419.1 hypothetical protein O4546_11550 [Salinivibrio kushneri]